MGKSNNQERTLRSLFVKCDIFSTIQFFRLKQESSYKTVTGGICTLIFFVLMIIIFSVRLYDTVNSNPKLTNISNVYASTPLLMKTSIQDRSKFMFAIRIHEIGSTYNSFFDIYLNTNNRVKLEPCNQSQWNLNGQIQNRLNRSSFNQNYLCLPKDTIINLQGLNLISIEKCTTSFCSNNTAILNNMTNKIFTLQMVFVNTFINPGGKDPLTYFIDDRNIMVFTLNSGGIIRLPFSKYEIQTTNNQIPLISQKLQRESGGFVDGLGQYSSYPTSELLYAIISLERSTRDMKFQRSYGTILDVLSYIGGLASTFLSILQIILNSYNQFAFQVQTSQKIFRIPKEQPKQNQIKISEINQDIAPPPPGNPQDKYIQKQKTNFLTFIKNKLCCKNKYITSFQRQINAQLDVQNIIKKLYKMQTFIKLMKEKFKDDKDIDFTVLQQKNTILINNEQNQEKEKANKEKEKDNLVTQDRIEIEFQK